MYLVHIVGGGKLKIYQENVRYILDWLRPSNVKETRSYLWVIQYWRKFITDFSNIASPLHGIMGKRKNIS